MLRKTNVQHLRVRKTLESIKLRRTTIINSLLSQYVPQISTPNYIMDNSIVQSQKFSFGDVAQSQYVTFQILSGHKKLPYNPFLFDLNLVIFKTRPGYEEVGTEYPLSRDKAGIFGRRKKQPKDWTDTRSVPIYLNAEKISQRHFSISQSYNLKDEGSKHGTFFWVDRHHPRKIVNNDIYLVAKSPLTILRAVHLPRPSIQMSYQGQIIKIPANQKIFLIGSHPRCDLVVSTLQHFQVCININTFTIFTHLEDEEAVPEHGLWYKLRQKEQIHLQHGNLILVDPYIFRVTS